jgi:hypothetical protein
MADTKVTPRVELANMGGPDLTKPDIANLKKPETQGRAC